MRQGIITGYEASMVFSARDEPAVETITVRLGGYPARHATQNEDGTYRLNLGDLVFPKVMPSGDIGFGFGEVDTVTFRIAPAPTRMLRRARFTPVRDPAHPPGPIATDLSAEFRMTSIQMSPAIRALADGVFVRDDAGPDPRPDRSVGGGSVIMDPAVGPRPATGRRGPRPDSTRGWYQAGIKGITAIPAAPCLRWLKL
ncbi:hypothetical protein [Methylobacterium sp. Leaf113]|uniref:hypothetical protein n=1 Tax=Methylobacterium sp. Leaf113 TaxID=1736259 RepID=UPI000AF28197|nr:hypothetical protein [Methylobacterium sp. Leaf113]